MNSPLLSLAPIRGFHCLAALGCLLFAACSSTGTTDPIRALAPASLLIAVEAPSDPISSTPSDAGEFSATPAQVQRMLADELRAVDASSRIVAAGDLGGERPDVVLRLVPNAARPIAFQHEGASNFLGAGGLWLVTWIGGMLVKDSRYSVAMDAKCQLALGQAWIERPIAGGEVDLAFFDRNDLLSMQGLQSLVLPPFWTSDQAGKTGTSLTSAAMKIAARQIAVVLKSEFEQAAAVDLGCAVELSTPTNGAPVAGAQMPIEFVATSRPDAPVTSVAVRVNGGAPVALTYERRRGEDRYAARGMLQGLDPTKENWVRIEIKTDRLHTRTLRLAARSGST